MSTTPHRLNARALASALRDRHDHTPVGDWLPCGLRAAHETDLIVFNDNGAWSWFEDERAVVDEFGGVLLVSSVANGSGSGGAARHGNVEVTTFDLAETSTERTVLHANLEADDHD